MHTIPEGRHSAACSSSLSIFILDPVTGDKEKPRKISGIWGKDGEVPAMEGFGEDQTAARERGYISTGLRIQRRRRDTEARLERLLSMVRSTSCSHCVP